MLGFFRLFGHFINCNWLIPAQNPYKSPQTPLSGVIKCFSDPEKNKIQFDELMDELLDRFILPGTKFNDDEDLTNTCPVCRKLYKNLKGLKKHMKDKKHFNSPNKVDADQDSQSDHKFNYVTNSLALCYLAKNFIDARKRGDGERICRLYKYFLLLFKLVGKNKYGNQSLNLLAQIKYFLPRHTEK